MIDPLNGLLSDGDQDFVRSKINEIKKEAKYEQIANETIMLLDALRLVSLMTHPGNSTLVFSKMIVYAVNPW